jgi:hypothetical protein
LKSSFSFFFSAALTCCRQCSICGHSSERV